MYKHRRNKDLLSLDASYVIFINLTRPIPDKNVKYREAETKRVVISYNLWDSYRFEFH